MTSPDTSTEKATQTLPLSISYTTSFPEILAHCGITLFVSTYQAGRLILLRYNGEGINAHFRQFEKVMGLALNQQKLAVGTLYEIKELYNQPILAKKLEPLGLHDSCYLLRNSHITGSIDIHEMAWGKENLWFINTRFSCLCTLDYNYSFYPQWRPYFITHLSPDDRCHLNGLAMIDGLPKYVTALGETNEPRGWRTNKANGGILMDVPSNQVLIDSLSMPHSPRYYQDQLWLLESGKGTISRVSRSDQKVTPVAILPGFTRGIDFYGDLAFIGLSQVRETAIFSGIPITETLTERTCGIWVVNLKTGQTVAYLKFDSGVQEIFAIQVLAGIRFPEVLTQDIPCLGNTFAIPTHALSDVTPEVRG